MQSKILPTKKLGFLVGLIILIILSFTLNDFVLWFDGIPLGLIFSIPGYFIGDWMGVMVGGKIGARINKVGISEFIGSGLGCVIGAMLSRAAFISF